MANPVKFDNLVKKLIQSTDSGNCDWKDQNDGSYRLLLTNGSVIFTAVYENVLDSYSYQVDLYDMKECFASYSSNPLTAGEYESLLANLYISIKEYQTRVKEEKMGMLYNSII